MSAPTCGEISCDECNARTAALTAERDQLRAALALGQQNCDDAYDDLRTERAAAITRAERAEAEVERLNALGSWAHTCLHHNDKQRTECPVCLVTTLTAEGDQLRAELAAECDQLRAEAERLRAGIGECLRQNGHLADGDNCTLIGLKRCLHNPTAARESKGGAA